MALLEARRLVKWYGRRCVVNGVDLNVNAGEIVGLLGPNGAGKTTSFRMMVGMIAPRSGHVFFNGEDVTRLPMYLRARLGLGYLAQDSSVFRKLTVEQNLWAILELMTTRRGEPYRASRREKRERVDQLLDQFGLTRLRKSNAAVLSGGERRRLEIARCLVSEPMLIMLDEPFTGIDPKTVGDIQAIVSRLRHSGIGVLITDHHVAETLRITDRSYLIAEGKVICEGTPLEVVNNPIAKEKYLGETFNAAGIGERLDVTPTASTVRSLLLNEKLFEMVEELGGPNYAAAVNALRERGSASVLPLIAGLERNDRNIRILSHRILCELVQHELPFNPDADEVNRLMQVAKIRSMLQQRKVG